MLQSLLRAPSPSDSINSEEFLRAERNNPREQKLLRSLQDLKLYYSLEKNRF